jgi:hypothetical protein
VTLAGNPVAVAFDGGISLTLTVEPPTFGFVALNNESRPAFGFDAEAGEPAMTK